jgi:hypothetical protein
MQLHPGHQRTQGGLGQLQHLGRRVHPHKLPLGLAVGKLLQLQAAACTEYQYLAGGWDAFAQQQGGHALQGLETRYQPHRAFGVAGNSVGV